MEEERKYFSRVDPMIAAILLGTTVMCWGCVFLFDTFQSKLIMIVANIPTSVILLGAFFYTYYYFQGDYLHWRTGLFYGKIQLSSIREIKQTKSSMEVSSAVKPCLALKPLLIKYNKYDDIPVSPSDVDEFIEELKTRVPDLKVNV